MKSLQITAILAITTLLFFNNCNRNRNKGEEQIPIDISGETTDTLSTTDTLNAVAGNSSMKLLPSYPQEVILSGMPEHRLISIYKKRKSEHSNKGTDYLNSRGYEPAYDADTYEHYMPGLDLQFGYNMLNLAYYHMPSGANHYLFPSPVLIKALYYPSFEPDSLYKKPIRRDYFLVSVYDEDTNKDTLINRFDLRRFYHFDATCKVKTQLVPADHSVIRSEYDPLNDAMFIYARKDENKNGKQDPKEPMHVFWIDLKNPEKAKQVY